MGQSDPPASLITVEAETRSLVTIRERVAAIATSCGADPDTIGDITLAASELATNVLIHTSSPTISVGVECADDVVVLEVSDADGLYSTIREAATTAESVTGRGLNVVRAVMDTVEFVERSGSRRVRCTKRTRR
jgi:anti-sigma regulatory factor (Ser/Thr protein kinase)